MTHVDWASLRNTTIERFNGELPHPLTEQEIIDAYELHPDAVERAIDAVAGELKAGQIRSGWGVLRHRAEAIKDPPSNPKAATGRQTEKRIARAEQWIRNAGLHCPGWDACREALLEDLHLNDVQADSLHELYEDLVTVAEQLERDAIARAQAWLASKTRLAEQMAAKTAELNAAQTQQPAGDFA